MHIRLRPLALGALALLLGGLLATLLALWAMAEAQPAVQRAQHDDSSAADTAGRVKALLLTHDPRRGTAQGERRLQLSGQDLDLLLHDGLRRAVHGSARLELSEGRALLLVSLPLHDGPLARFAPMRLLGSFGPWLNLRAQLQATPQGLPQLESLHIGRLRTPVWLLAWLSERVAAHLNLALEYELARSFIDQLLIHPDAIELAYHWRPEWRDRLRAALIQPADQARLRAANDLLAALVTPGVERPAGQPVTLVELLPPLFELARQRATVAASVSGQDPLAAEHRAALITLAMYATGQPLARLVPDARDWREPYRRVVTLQGRDDFAQHFLVSAVLAAEGGSRLSDMIGVYKEMADTRDGGSGFSFNDIAADRAGTRFGQRSVRQPGPLAERIGPDLKESDLLPALDDLPQFLTDEEFHDRFGTVGSPAYREMLQRIEQRIDGLPTLQ